MDWKAFLYGYVAGSITFGILTAFVVFCGSKLLAICLDIGEQCRQECDAECERACSERELTGKD
jgi:hypothetical protein